MDAYRVYTVLHDYASASNDIDLKRSMGIPPRKLRTDDDLIDDLKEVLKGKRLNIFNSENELSVDVFHSIQHGMVITLNPGEAYDWFTGELIKCESTIDLEPLPHVMIQRLLTKIDEYIAATPASEYIIN